MKKLNAWVKNLSLSQQLFVLIFFFIAFFSSFFFIFLTGNVDDFIRDQMFNIIDRNQSIIVNLYKMGVDEDKIITLQLEDTQKDTMMIHIFYTDKGNYSSASETLNNNRSLTLTIGKQLLKQMEDGVEVGHYTYDGGYYAINIASPNFAVVSLVTKEYRTMYRDTLLSSVINITVIAVGVFFIVLMIWMGYLIHPLNQIRNYIEKIKLGEDAELKVNRNDEIGELADALVSMRQELKRQEKTKEEMIHNISHDLKTPIATIKSYGESIKDGIYPYDTLEKSVDVIIDNANRLERKVHSLLYLNRVEYLVSQNTGEKRTNMKEVIEEVLLAMKAVKPDIEIKADLKEVYFNCSKEPWRITVENLLENSLRYAQTQVKIKLNEDELSISNDGPCMSESRIASLFKPFEKGQGGQFGIGLSIVYKVTTANGYNVSGENMTKGVIFRINKFKA